MKLKKFEILYPNYKRLKNLTIKTCVVCNENYPARKRGASKSNGIRTKYSLRPSTSRTCSPECSKLYTYRKKYLK